jgi:hypothetical protein
MATESSSGVGSSSSAEAKVSETTAEKAVQIGERQCVGQAGFVGRSG